MHKDRSGSDSVLGGQPKRPPAQEGQREMLDYFYAPHQDLLGAGGIFLCYRRIMTTRFPMAWISPQGRVHAMREGEDHASLLAKFFGTKDISDATLREAYSTGWISVGHEGLNEVGMGKCNFNETRSRPMRALRNIVAASGTDQLNVAVVDAGIFLIEAKPLVKGSIKAQYTSDQVIEFLDSIAERGDYLDNQYGDIDSYPVWELKKIPISTLDFSDENVSEPESKERVAAYSKLRTEAPPIIVVPSDDGKMRIVDGYHRTAVASNRGAKEIMAYVPIKLTEKYSVDALFGEDFDYEFTNWIGKKQMGEALPSGVTITDSIPDGVEIPIQHAGEGDVPEGEWEEDETNYRLNNTDAIIYAIKNKKVIGHLGLKDNKVETVYIDPDQRGNGIALELYLYAVREYGDLESDSSAQEPGGKGIWKALKNLYPDRVELSGGVWTFRQEAKELGEAKTNIVELGRGFANAVNDSQYHPLNEMPEALSKVRGLILYRGVERPVSEIEKVYSHDGWQMWTTDKQLAKKFSYADGKPYGALLQISYTGQLVDLDKIRDELKSHRAELKGYPEVADALATYSAEEESFILPPGDYKIVSTTSGVSRVELESTDPKYDASVQGAFDMLTKQKAWIPESRTSVVPADLADALHVLQTHLEDYKENHSPRELEREFNSAVKRAKVKEVSMEFARNNFRMAYHGRKVNPKSIDNPIVVAHVSGSHYEVLDGSHRLYHKNKDGSKSIRALIIEAPWAAELEALDSELLDDPSLDLGEQKELSGYTISHKMDGNKIHVVTHDKDGNKVGQVTFVDKGDHIKNAPAHIVSVEEPHQRKGIATAMYQYAEKLTGKKARRGMTTGAGAKLWDQPNRPFGESVEDEMKEWFTYRTNLHIGLVRKYLDKIMALDLPELDTKVLETEKDHDCGKWEAPEYEPYLHVTWKYKMKDQGKEYKPPADTSEKMREATYHHVKSHKHHPEFWDDSTTPDAINPKDRDKTPEMQIDATKMPIDYVASMVADWLAMSDEKGTSIHEWVKNNVNVRWKFTPEQVALIEKLVEMVPVDEKGPIREDFEEWDTGKWVHYSKVPYLQINPKQFHQDPAGIYLFPEEFDIEGNWGSYPYKIVVELKSQLNTLDFQDLKTPEECFELVDKLVPDPKFKEGLLEWMKTLKSPADGMWDQLKNHFILKTGAKGPAAWSKALRSLGYDAIFDDTGAVHVAETQLIVLDPTKVRLVEVIDQKKQVGSGFDIITQAMDRMVEIGKEFGEVKRVEPKKEKISWQAEQTVVGRVNVKDASFKIYLQAGDRGMVPDQLTAWLEYPSIETSRTAGAKIKDGAPVWGSFDRDVRGILEKIWKQEATDNWGIPRL